jgi:hypothetical protein
MSAHDLEELDEFRQGTGLSHGELWLRYFELGGMSTGFELEAFPYGVHQRPMTTTSSLMPHQ